MGPAPPSTVNGRPRLPVHPGALARRRLECPVHGVTPQVQSLKIPADRQKGPSVRPSSTQLQSITGDRVHSVRHWPTGLPGIGGRRAASPLGSAVRGAQPQPQDSHHSRGTQPASSCSGQGRCVLCTGTCAWTPQDRARIWERGCMQEVGCGHCGVATANVDTCSTTGPMHAAGLGCDSH